MNSFSTRLLEARKAAGYSNQESFAKVLKIPQQTYGNYESGRSFPKEEILREIGVALGVSIDSLLGIEPLDTASKSGDLNVRISKLKKNAIETSTSIEMLLDSIRKLEEAL